MKVFIIIIVLGPKYSKNMFNVNLEHETATLHVSTSNQFQEHTHKCLQVSAIFGAFVSAFTVYSSTGASVMVWSLSLLQKSM